MITPTTITIHTTQITVSNALAETAATVFQYPTALTVPNFLRQAHRFSSSSPLSTNFGGLRIWLRLIA
jgi:hypothetical protein